MMKTQIGLGVLSIPAAFDTLGLIPGVLCMLAICFITLWSNHMVGVFKLNHPEVYGIEDVGKKLFGRIGSEVFGLTFALCASPPLAVPPKLQLTRPKQSGPASPAQACWASPLASTRSRCTAPARLFSLPSPPSPASASRASRP